MYANMPARRSTKYAKKSVKKGSTKRPYTGPCAAASPAGAPAPPLALNAEIHARAARYALSKCKTRASKQKAKAAWTKTEKVASSERAKANAALRKWAGDDA
jgi:hypothetical protein